MINTAHVIETIKATAKGEFATLKVFRVAGKPGIWRQLKREGRSGLKTSAEREKDGVIVAAFDDDKLLELQRWGVLENEMLLSQREADEGEETGVRLDGDPPAWREGFADASPAEAEA